MRLEVSTVMLQWSAGGLAFLWLTTRRREVGIGYGWLLRGIYAALAAIALAASIAGGGEGFAVSVFRVASGATAVAALATLAVSASRRRLHATEAGPAFPPALDLVAPLCGAIGIVAAASIDGGPYLLTLVRFVAGAGLLGAATDAMLLGHWYLVQPGLDRDPIRQLVLVLAIVWALDVIVYLVPTGVVSVFTGSIDDGYGGLLAWIWLVSAITTVALAGVAWLALREQYYSAVMAATGLLYLAILTAFGTDLVARALLA